MCVFVLDEANVGWGQSGKRSKSGQDWLKGSVGTEVPQYQSCGRRQCKRNVRKRELLPQDQIKNGGKVIAKWGDLLSLATSDCGAAWLGLTVGPEEWYSGGRGSRPWAPSFWRPTGTSFCNWGSFSSASGEWEKARNHLFIVLWLIYGAVRREICQFSVRNITWFRDAALEALVSSLEVLNTALLKWYMTCCYLHFK